MYDQPASSDGLKCMIGRKRQRGGDGNATRLIRQARQRYRDHLSFIALHSYLPGPLVIRTARQLARRSEMDSARGGDPATKAIGHLPGGTHR